MGLKSLKYHHRNKCKHQRARDIQTYRTSNERGKKRWWQGSNDGDSVCCDNNNSDSNRNKKLKEEEKQQQYKLSGAEFGMNLKIGDDN